MRGLVGTRLVRERRLNDHQVHQDSARLLKISYKQKEIRTWSRTRLEGVLHGEEVGTESCRVCRVIVEDLSGRNGDEEDGNEVKDRDEEGQRRLVEGG